MPTMALALCHARILIKSVAYLNGTKTMGHSPKPSRYR